LSSCCCIGVLVHYFSSPRITFPRAWAVAFRHTCGGHVAVGWHIHLLNAAAATILLLLLLLLVSSSRTTLPYSCPAWEFAAGSYLLKLQRLQNKVLRTIGNLPKHKPTCDLHMAFKIPYLYDFITKLCRQQTNSHTKS